LKQLSDGEVLISRGVSFQICGAAEEKAPRTNSVFVVEWQRFYYNRRELTANQMSSNVLNN